MFEEYFQYCTVVDYTTQELRSKPKSSVTSVRYKTSLQVLVRHSTVEYKSHFLERGSGQIVRKDHASIWYRIVLEGVCPLNLIAGEKRSNRKLHHKGFRVSTELVTSAQYCTLIMNFLYNEYEYWYVLVVGTYRYVLPVTLEYCTTRTASYWYCMVRYVQYVPFGSGLEPNVRTVPVRRSTRRVQQCSYW